VLSQLQRRLRKLLAAPEGVAAALREAGDPTAASLAGFVVSDAILAALPRLEVYANAYFLRILDALKDDFGALAAALGPEGIHDVVTAYLLAHPPRHPSLRHAGNRLSAFLADDPRAAPFRRRWPWCADLARLETALQDAFDAPDAPALGRERLATLAPDAWPALRLRVQPCVRVLRLAWPVAALYTAWESDASQTPPAAPEANCVLVWRRDESVRWRALESLEAELLESTQAGARFEALCEIAATARGEAAAPALVAGLLGRWVETGLLAAE
jgi:hypothetical protein